MTFFINRHLEEDQTMKEDSADAGMVRSVFDALPALVFVVDDDVRIQDYNAAAADFMSAQQPAVIKRRGGDVFHCIHSADVLEGCGRGPFCKDCVVRNSVAEAFQGNRVVRRRARIEIIRGDDKTELYALVTVSPFRYNERPLALLVIEDISEIAELRRMIPICSVCRKIRDEKEAWLRVEAYFKEHWDVDFTHSFCPECYEIVKEQLKREAKSRA